MKPIHNAEARAKHYSEAIEKIIKYERGLFATYFACIILWQLNGCHDDFDIELEYPEFWEQKPVGVGSQQSWFWCNEDRITALKKAIELVKYKIETGELD